MGAGKNIRSKPDRACLENAMKRFRAKCRFEPETGCVVWVGGTTSGRGHHVPYGSFWYDNARWFAHRFAAKFIHGLNIDKLQVDHACPHIPMPNTLCMEHLQVVTLEENRHLQTERRRRFVELQVGLLSYEDVYGPPVDDDGPKIPFFARPAWLDHCTGEPDEIRNNPCPF